jgi:hypothetical protein
MTAPSLSDRVLAIERITALFRAERLVYLILTTVALLLLIVSAIAVLFAKGDPSIATLTMLFGSSGLITISFARLLRMWDRAVDLLSAAATEPGK